MLIPITIWFNILISSIIHLYLKVFRNYLWLLLRLWILLFVFYYTYTIDVKGWLVGIIMLDAGIGKLIWVRVVLKWRRVWWVLLYWCWLGIIEVAWWFFMVFGIDWLLGWWFVKKRLRLFIDSYGLLDIGGCLIFFNSVITVIEYIIKLHDHIVVFQFFIYITILLFNIVFDIYFIIIRNLVISSVWLYTLMIIIVIIVVNITIIITIIRYFTLWFMIFQQHEHLISSCY
jgi:hypothetical protein